TQPTGSAIDTSGIAAALDEAAYQTVRTGASFFYSVPGLAAGTTYRVRLHFAELSWNDSGRRIMNVDLNGGRVLENFDVLATAGARGKAVVRDFDVAADQAGRIFDPVGEGVADALAGRVVFVGDPETRIQEDYLRILRFFRFYAWYGQGEPDAAALTACATFKEGMARLSAERISKELLKLLSARNPAPAVALMIEAGVMDQFAPEACNAARLARIGYPDAILRLAALLPDDAHLAKHFAERLRLSNADRDRLAAALTTEPPLPESLDARAVRRILYDIGLRAYADRLALAGRTTEDTTGIAGDWNRPQLPIGGEDVAVLGIPKGPMVGKLLRKVEAWWVENDFPAERRTVLRKLSEFVRA
ncbi:MAG: malectin domain-containing carbohydrate-binding protein, partial [Alphaproteobacteria bacterium]